jgi:hypothetical protein
MVPEFVDIVTVGAEERAEAASVAIAYRTGSSESSRLVVAFSAGRTSTPPPWAIIQQLPAGGTFTVAAPPPELPHAASYYWWDEATSHRFVTVDASVGLDAEAVKQLLSGSGSDCGS